MIAFDAKLPLFALACGVVGFLFSSTTLIAVAVILASVAVAFGVARIGPPDMWKSLKRRRRRSR